MRKRSFSEDAVLEKIRFNCVENLGDLLTNGRDVFLISNHFPAKWDFARLTQAILDTLTKYQQETLILALGNVLTRSSNDLFQRKVEVLRGRIWMVASASAAAALVPIPGVSFGVDAALILRELSFYRSQLGLPEEGSAEFATLPFSTQEKVRKVCLTTAAQLGGFLAAYSAEAVLEDVTRFIPFVGLAIASGMSFTATYFVLHKLLQQVEEAAKLVLREAAQKAIEEID